MRLFVILVLTINSLMPQELKNGEYISNKTSYQDFKNKERNFVEYFQYNLTIQIQSNEGTILIHDHRMANTPLIYKIYSKGKEVTNSNIVVTFFEAYTEHLKTPIKTSIGIYKSKGSFFNLIVADSISSQVFHDLKEVNSE